MIRPYEETDQDFLNQINPIAVFELLYHGDVLKDSSFTSVDDSGNVKGIVYLKYHYTWNGAKEAYHKIVPCIYVGEDNEFCIYNQLLTYIINWLEARRDITEKKHAALVIWEDSRNIADLQNLMHLGFMEYEVCPCQKYDLTTKHPDFPIPEGFHVEELVYEPGQVNKFIQATEVAHDGTGDSAAELWFMSGDDSHKVFLLMDGKDIVASTAIWKISDEQAAIENIFTSPNYRRRNCARAIISYGLQELANEGYSFATLSMLGINEKAGRLYQSLGFELYFNQIEMLFPIH